MHFIKGRLKIYKKKKRKKRGDHNYTEQHIIYAIIAHNNSIQNKTHKYLILNIFHIYAGRNVINDIFLGRYVVVKGTGSHNIYFP